MRWSLALALGLLGCLGRGGPDTDETVHKRSESHVLCKGPDPVDATSLEGFCVGGRVIWDSPCVGNPHGAVRAFCAQVVTREIELGGKQITVVSDTPMFRDGDLVRLVLGARTDEPNRQLKLDDVWRAPWPDPYLLGEGPNTPSTPDDR